MKLFSRRKRESPPPPQDADRSTSPSQFESRWSVRAPALTFTPLLCTDERQYVAAATDLVELEKATGVRKLLPVLATGGAALQSPVDAVGFVQSPSLPRVESLDLAELLRSGNRAESENPPKRLLLADPACATIGAGIARMMESHIEIVDSILEIERRSESITRDSGQPVQVLVVALVETSARWGIVSLGRALTTTASPPPEWGLITAATLDEISWIAAKSISFEPKPRTNARLFWGFSPAPSIASRRISVVDSMAMEPEAAERASQVSSDIDLFVGHGRSHCHASGVLCTGDPRNPETPLRCAGAFDCVRVDTNPRQPVMRASVLRTDVLFLQSCLAGGFFATAASIGHNIAVEALRGTTTAVVTTTGGSQHDPIAPFLFLDFLRRGQTLGEATARMNSIADRVLGQSDAYVLYGDPSSQWSLPSPASRPIEAGVVWDRAVACIELPTPQDGVQAYCFRDAQLLDYVREGSLRIRIDFLPGEDMWIRAFPSVETGSVELLTVWIGAVPTEPVTLHIDRDPVVDSSVISVAHEMLRARERIADIDTLDSDADSLDDPTRCDDGSSVAEHLDPLHLVRGLSRDIERETAGSLGVCYSIISVRLTNELIQAGSELERRIEQANESFVRRFAAANRTMVLLASFYQMGLGCGFLGERQLSERCPICEGALKKITYRIGVADELRREVTECEHCELHCDVEAGMETLCVRGPSTLSQGHVERFRLSIPNATPNSCVVHVAPSSYLSKAHGDCFTYSPQSAGGWLDAGESLEVEFDVEPLEDAPFHEHRLQFHIAINGRLSIAYRMVRVVSEESIDEVRAQR